MDVVMSSVSPNLLTIQEVIKKAPKDFTVNFSETQQRQLCQYLDNEDILEQFSRMNIFSLWQTLETSGYEDSSPAALLDMEHLGAILPLIFEPILQKYQNEITLEAIDEACDIIDYVGHFAKCHNESIKYIIKSQKNAYETSPFDEKDYLFNVICEVIKRFQQSPVAKDLDLAAKRRQIKIDNQILDKAIPNQKPKILKALIKAAESLDARIKEQFPSTVDDNIDNDQKDVLAAFEELFSYKSSNEALADQDKASLNFVPDIPLEGQNLSAFIELVFKDTDIDKSLSLIFEVTEFLKHNFTDIQQSITNLKKASFGDFFDEKNYLFAVIIAVINDIQEKTAPKNETEKLQRIEGILNIQNWHKKIANEQRARFSKKNICLKMIEQLDKGSLETLSNEKAITLINEALYQYASIYFEDDALVNQVKCTNTESWVNELLKSIENIPVDKHFKSNAANETLNGLKLEIVKTYLSQNTPVGTKSDEMGLNLFNSEAFNQYLKVALKTNMPLKDIIDGIEQKLNQVFVNTDWYKHSLENASSSEKQLLNEALVRRLNDLEKTPTFFELYEYRVAQIKRTQKKEQSAKTSQRMSPTTILKQGKEVGATLVDNLKKYSTSQKNKSDSSAPVFEIFTPLEHWQYIHQVSSDCTFEPSFHDEIRAQLGILQKHSSKMTVNGVFLNDETPFMLYNALISQKYASSQEKRTKQLDFIEQVEKTKQDSEYQKVVQDNNNDDIWLEMLKKMPDDGYPNIKEVFFSKLNKKILTEYDAKISTTAKEMLIKAGMPYIEIIQHKKKSARENIDNHLNSIGESLEILGESYFELAKTLIENYENLEKVAEILRFCSQTPELKADADLNVFFKKYQIAKKFSQHLSEENKKILKDANIPYIEIIYSREDNYSECIDIDEVSNQLVVDINELASKLKNLEQENIPLITAMVKIYDISICSDMIDLINEFKAFGIETNSAKFRAGFIIRELYKKSKENVSKVIDNILICLDTIESNKDYVTHYINSSFLEYLNQTNSNIESFINLELLTSVYNQPNDDSNQTIIDKITHQLTSILSVSPITLALGQITKRIYDKSVINAFNNTFKQFSFSQNIQDGYSLDSALLKEKDKVNELLQILAPHAYLFKKEWQYLEQHLKNQPQISFPQKAITTYWQRFIHKLTELWIKSSLCQWLNKIDFSYWLKKSIAKTQQYQLLTEDTNNSVAIDDTIDDHHINTTSLEVESQHDMTEIIDFSTPETGVDVKLSTPVHFVSIDDGEEITITFNPQTDKGITQNPPIDESLDTTSKKNEAPRTESTDISSNIEAELDNISINSTETLIEDLQQLTQVSRAVEKTTRDKSNQEHPTLIQAKTSNCRPSNPYIKQGNSKNYDSSRFFTSMRSGIATVHHKSLKTVDELQKSSSNLWTSIKVR